MVTEIVVIVFLLLILLVLIILMSGRNRAEKEQNNLIPLVESNENFKEFYGSKCPLCGEFLPRGERVHSHLYPGKPDGLMHIFGCPHCYAEHPKGNGRATELRICPYCKDTLSSDDYVIARVFEKPGKTQVHVLGCTICREKR